MYLLISQAINRFGYKLTKNKIDQFPSDFLKEYDQIKAYTMVDYSGAFAVWTAVDYVVTHSIEGAIVECGVWRGGVSILMARRLAFLGDVSREQYLYDSFEGMSEPTDEDIDKHGVAASDQLSSTAKKDQDQNVWAYASLDGVKNNFNNSGVTTEKINFVVGRVEDSIPEVMPEKISILRLDTDWYESTLHELENLYPILEVGGVLLIDDYSYWKGCRKAVEEYFSKHKNKPYFSILPNGSVSAIKV